MSTLCNPMDYSLPGSSVHGFSRQEYWSGLPFPPTGDLPNPEIEPMSHALTGKFFTTEPPGKPNIYIYLNVINIHYIAYIIIIPNKYCIHFLQQKFHKFS